MAPKKTTKKTVTSRKSNPKPKKKPTANPVNAELIAILNELEQSEVKWLINQAKTMVYNHKVEEVNKAAKDLAGNTRNTGSTEKKPSNTVDIVQTGGAKSFNILMGNARLFLNLQELKAMVKIAAATEDAGDGAGRLYRWCRKERNDILIDGGISNPGDNRLKNIYSILRENFTVG